MSTHNEPNFESRVNAERAMLMPPFNVVMAARITGALAPDAVRGAVQRLRERHPLLAARVAFDSEGGARFLTEGVPAVPLRVVEADGQRGPSDPRWLDEVMRECRTSFDLETGPLSRFVIIRGGDTTRLLVTGHHAICDGKSLAYLLRDVLQAVAEPDAEVERLGPPPPIDETTVPAPPRTPWIARVILRKMGRKWNSKGLRFDAQDRKRLHEAFWAAHTGGKALAWELTPAQTADLVARCRAEDVTVNSALWTAFLLAQHEVQGDREAFRRQAGLAVSTRERLNVPVGEALGFYASSLSLALPVDAGAEFWDAARKIQARIRKALGRTDLFRMLVANALPPTLLDSLYPEKYGLIHDRMSARMLRQMKWDRLSYGYSITNVGRAEIPTAYGTHTLEALHGPFFYSDVNEKVVGVSTVGGVLSFTLTGNEDQLGAGVAERLRDASLDHLKRAVSPAA